MAFFSSQTDSNALYVWS